MGALSKCACPPVIATGSSKDRACIEHGRRGQRNHQGGADHCRWVGVPPYGAYAHPWPTGLGSAFPSRPLRPRRLCLCASLLVSGRSRSLAEDFSAGTAAPVAVSGSLEAAAAGDRTGSPPWAPAFGSEASARPLGGTAETCTEKTCLESGAVSGVERLGWTSV